MGSQPAVRDLRRFLPVRTRFQPNPIMHGVAESLFAAQLPFRRLYRHVPQQKLNLLQIVAGLMAKTGASSPQVVRRERRNITVFCFLFDDAPNDLGTESGAPNHAALPKGHVAPRGRPGRHRAPGRRFVEGRTILL